MNTSWPVEISDAVERSVGRNVEASSPGGMSDASVVRLRGERGAAILKRSSNAREWHVYTVLRPLLHDEGVVMPELLAGSAGDGVWWLLLEDIPHPLPEDRWLADPELVGMLRNLASVPASPLRLPPDRYIPAWPPEMTASALSLFDDAVAERLSEPLAFVRERCLPLLEPFCPVSADPNPGNWGLRDDGSLVLFDWERFTLATPPVDLAISVPGLGDMEAFAAVSRAYSGDERVAPGIAWAKVWSVIEFLAGYARGEIEPAFELEPLLATIPGWVTGIVRATR